MMEFDCSSILYYESHIKNEKYHVTVELKRIWNIGVLNLNDFFKN